MKLCKDCKHYYKTKNYDYCERKAKPATYVRMLLEKAYPKIFSRVDA